MIARARHWAVAAALLLVLVSSPAPGQEEPPIQSAVTAVSPAPWIDRLYFHITRYFNQRVRAVDSYFAQHEPLDSDRESQLRVRLFVDHSEVRTRISPRISADLQMPRLERRFDLYVQNIKRNVLPGEDAATETDRVQLGARGDIFRGGRWAITRDVGVRFSRNIKLYAEVAGHFRCYWERWEGTATQTLFWNRDDDFGALSRLIFDRKLTSDLYLRLQSAARYTQEQDYWRTAQEVRVGWVIEEEQQYLVGSLVALGQNQFMEEYRSELTYRSRIYRPWIFIEITPYLSFPRDRGFDSTPGLRIGLDLFFGGVPRL